MPSSVAPAGLPPPGILGGPPGPGGGPRPGTAMSLYGHGPEALHHSMGSLIDEQHYGMIQANAQRGPLVSLKGLCCSGIAFLASKGTSIGFLVCAQWLDVHILMMSDG